MDEKPDAVLDEAEKHLEEGRQGTARSLLAGYLKSQPRSERAWWLMSFAVTEQNQKVDCLQRVLAINPFHEDARSRLDSILNPTEPPEFEGDLPQDRWEIEPGEEAEHQVEEGVEEDEAVTEDLGDFETPAGDIWEEEVQQSETTASEEDLTWDQELETDEALTGPEPGSLWEEELEIEVEPAQDSGTIWTEEPSQVFTQEGAAIEDERPAEPRIGTTGVYGSPSQEARPAQKGKGRSNRTLFWVLILIFALVAVLACGLLGIALGFFQFNFL
jgi:hypothetical protein